MKKFIYLFSILLLLTSCWNTKSKIISKADDLFGESEQKDNIIRYRHITADNINKDFYTLRDYITHRVDAKPVVSQQNQLRADQTGRYTAYIWDTQHIYVILWLNHPAKEQYIQLTFKKKSSGGI